MKPGDLAEAERKQREKHIVLTAAELFLERGAENVRMTDIADECGIGVDGFNDLLEGDVIEAFVMEEVKRT